MEIRNNSSALDSLLLQLIKSKNNTAATQNAGATPAPRAKAKVAGQDVVSLSGGKPDENGQNAQSKLSQNQTQLVSENTEQIENGFRRVQEFENGQGKKFTRIEEFTTTPDRARRTVVQQNDSGSTNVVDNVYDRQADGAFRLTQKYTDEIGEVKTNIEFGVTPDNANVILGQAQRADQLDNNPFKQLRGTQFDITA